MTRDWKKEALDALEAKWAEEEAQWQRENVGKVRFYLINATDEPETLQPESQIELRSLMQAIRKSKIEIDAPFLTCDSVEAVGGYTGEITMLATAFGPILTGIFGAWMQSKVGRKVRLKDGDIEIEARTVEEVGKLLDMVAEQRAKREPKEDQ